MNYLRMRGVTLLELLVVLVIVALLSTVAVGIYGKEVMRAKYSRARAEIRTLEIAIARYEIDTGQLPPSGSGVTIAPTGIVTSGTAQGSGYLQLALRASLNGFPNDPLSLAWKGPYVDWDYNRMGDLNGVPVTDLGTTLSPGEVNFLDPFGGPYFYIRSSDYALRGGTQIPAGEAFSASETYYNPSTYQIFSLGADRQTDPVPNRGLAADDVTNFFSPRY